MNKILYICILLIIANPLFAETIFTYLVKEDVKDTRNEYNNALLKLALDKTIDTYGSYKLVPSPPMNYARAEIVAEHGDLTNFIFKDSVRKELLSKLGYIPFPID
jgi:hypothetical protein